jgi:hypothetical protein
MQRREEIAETALVGVAEAGDADSFDNSWWFEPFGLDPPTIAKELLPNAFKEARVVVGCAANRAVVAFPLPPGEPEGILLTWPSARCGLATLVIDLNGRKSLTAGWPFTTDGIEHEIEIGRVLLAPDRMQAVIEGTIGEELSLSWLDVLFPVDRAYYARGSVHRVNLAGFAHRFSLRSPPPLRITPDAPVYEGLRDMNPAAVDEDGAITIRTEGVAAILPVDDAPATLYSIQGPVKRIDEYGGNLFDRKVWDVRVTVARIGDDMREVDLPILLTDLILAGRPLPKAGDDISAIIRLQGRILWPNVQRSI